VIVWISEAESSPKRPKKKEHKMNGKFNDINSADETK
jgi:hypothetical protein